MGCITKPVLTCFGESWVPWFLRCPALGYHSSSWGRRRSGARGRAGSLSGSSAGAGDRRARQGGAGSGRGGSPLSALCPPPGLASHCRSASWRPLASCVSPGPGPGVGHRRSRDSGRDRPRGAPWGLAARLVLPPGRQSSWISAPRGTRVCLLPGIGQFGARAHPRWSPSLPLPRNFVPSVALPPLLLGTLVCRAPLTPGSSPRQVPETDRRLPGLAGLAPAPPGHQQSQPAGWSPRVSCPPGRLGEVRAILLRGLPVTVSLGGEGCVGAVPDMSRCPLCWPGAAANSSTSGRHPGLPASALRCGGLPARPPQLRCRPLDGVLLDRHSQCHLTFWDHETADAVGKNLRCATPPRSPWIRGLVITHARIPEDVHVLVPGPGEYVTVRGERGRRCPHPSLWHSDQWGAPCYCPRGWGQPLPRPTCWGTSVAGVRGAGRKGEAGRGQGTGRCRRGGQEVTGWGRT